MATLHQVDELPQADVEVEGRVEAQPLPGGQSFKEGPRRGVVQGRQRAVLHHDALGRARGARRVENVGRIVLVDEVSRDVVRRQRREPRGVRVENNAVPHVGLPVLDELLVRHQHGGLAVFEDERLPLRRCRRVDGHEGASRLHHRQYGDDRLRRALQAQRHARLWTYAQRPQVRGQLIRPGVELGVRQGLFAQDHGECLRRPRCLLLEAQVEQCAEPCRGLRATHTGATPVLQQPPTLRVRMQGQGGSRELRLGHHGIQHQRQVGDQPLHPCRLEQLGAEDEVS
ncbi:hypothetical protein GCM10012319_59640 [Comamonas sp. KCTC 72670]|nr:hypothetical protein GCM10012319_59640 [Comamonas sp. KCTC 72670]